MPGMPRRAPNLQRQRRRPAETGDTAANLGHRARHFVSEQCRHLQHARMSATSKHFNVGAASCGCLYAKQELALRRPLYRHIADLDLFRAEQHGAAHGLRDTAH